MSAYGHGLPSGVELSSPWRRLAGALLEGVLIVVTVLVGWIVWSIIVWGRGQTPAKQLLDMTVMVEGEQRRAGRGRMLWRELPAKWIVLAVPGAIALAVGPRGSHRYALVDTALTLVVLSWLLWDSDNQELWDKLASTLVVSDPFHALAKAGSPGRASGAAIAAAAPTAPPPPRSALAHDRAVEYFRAGQHEVALTLLRQSAQDASRRGDEHALRDVLHLMSQAEKRLPPEFRTKAAEIVRIAKTGLKRV
jgi:uncharacterized RDD family membrane protein YckC